jgi:rhamnogalacturonyl hydrolase YesR
MYMAPPFIAYYGAATNNASLLREAADQCVSYRQILQANTTAPYKGVWHHIIGANSQDLGLWSSGNGWAAAGATRVLATVMKAPIAYSSSWRFEVIEKLTEVIKEIIDGAMNSPPDDGLLRNYLNDTATAHGYGELSGSTLLASVVYRMAVLKPDCFTWEYIEWAEGIRTLLGRNDAHGNPHVTANGTITPTVNPLNWYDTTPFTAGSPEGQNFVVLLYAAWRDCIQAGICVPPYTN